MKVRTSILSVHLHEKRIADTYFRKSLSITNQILKLEECHVSPVAKYFVTGK
jgi:hypothetical protein